MTEHADKSMTGKYIAYGSLKEDDQLTSESPKLKGNLSKKKDSKSTKHLMQKIFKTNSIKHGASLELADISPRQSQSVQVQQNKVRTSSLSETISNLKRAETRDSIGGCQSEDNVLNNSNPINKSGHKESPMPSQPVDTKHRKHSLKSYSLNSGVTDKHLYTGDIILNHSIVPGVTQSTQQTSTSPKHGKHRTLSNNTADCPSGWTQDTDVGSTKMYLESLNEHIKKIREKLLQVKNEKTSRTEELLNQMQHTEENPSSSITSPEIKRQFEECNRQTYKTARDLQSDLDSLLYRKQMLETWGIPHGVNAKEYVKNLSNNRKESNATKKKSGMFENMKHGFDGVMGGMVGNMKGAAGSIKRSLKSNSSKSLSMENISPEAHKEHYKSPSNGSSSNKSQKKGKHSSSIEDGVVILSKVPNTNPNPTVSANRESEANLARSTARSSISSSVGDILSGPVPYSAAAPRPSVGSHTQEENQKSDNQDALIIREDLSVIRKELAECREDNLVLKGTLESLCREMKTHADIHRHRMQNSAEKIDRLDKLVEDCNQQIYREFASCKEELHHLDEKFNYKLTTTTRDLRDCIDTLNNSMNLLEKRVEQCSYSGSDSQRRKDSRVIYNNFMNVGVSVVAFLMVILSGCFHFLIRVINFGAVLVQHKLKLVFIVLPVIVVTFLIYPYRSDIIDAINSYSLPLSIKETLRGFK